ncbi:GNAT family N-acetyltransferase [Flavimaricola marinus]|uniref:Ribosomal-protein-alanine N-acetyltransferase n=1 Tax=Flavimaricola marinus TaxID=1819565 RepID=A0A238L8W4_9RHOB|nr:GNAT family N-acetyltransferase [Flavimaricola marinus]SMY06041.1 ribosomal-protein-alanine N-acetyltransferase [Flavimaricola marinus]
MKPADLARIHQAAFTETRAWSVDEFENLMVQAGILLTSSGPAFVLGRIVVDEAEILTLACDPAGQRHGHATNAMSRFEEEAALRGVERIFLEVAEDNEPAQNLYASAGYTETGRRPGYYRTVSGQRVAALILSKALHTE